MKCKKTCLLLCLSMVLVGCSSTGVGMAKDGNMYYFDNQCTTYDLDPQRNGIYCYDSAGHFTGKRHPLDPATAQNLILQQQLQEQIAQQQFQQAIQNLNNNRIRQTFCNELGNSVHCTTF